MTIKLPPLPEPESYGRNNYSKEQLRTAQREAALMALEEAAKVCDSMPTQDESGLCASAIRALRTKLEAP